MLLADADVRDYLDPIGERSEPWTHLKIPYLRALGPDADWYRVGPLARLQVCDRRPTPWAQARCQHLLVGGPVHATLAYQRARMVEMLHAIEVIAELLTDETLVAGDLAAPLPIERPGVRRGVGVIEAPRGTLIHHYDIGNEDLISACNLIVSTTHNNRAMNEAVRVVADQTFGGRDISEPMLNAIEVAIRDYDPCSSCATHAFGAMPLAVELLDADGAARARC